MFYTAEALLVVSGMRFSKHAGVHAAFGQHFAKSGELDPIYHRWLLDAFDKRIAADYGIDISIGGDEVEEMIRRAEQFLGAARQYLTPRHE